jgi:sugar-specific transcriptional regulator TrmB
MTQDELQEIGLTRNEAKIYRYLLESGSASIGEISSKSGLHRRNVYDSIEKLKGNGFVSWTIKDGKRYFQAMSPQRLLVKWDEKRELLKSAISSLKPKAGPHGEPTVRVFTGNEGRKIVFEEKLKYGEEQLVLGAHRPSQRISRYIESFHRRREARKIPLKMLFPQGEIRTAKKFAKLKHVKVKILPKAICSPIAINIYSNKVALFMGSSSHSPLSILIEDGQLSNDFRSYFSMLWKVSKRLNRFP